MVGQKKVKDCIFWLYRYVDTHSRYYATYQVHYYRTLVRASEERSPLQLNQLISTVYSYRNADRKRQSIYQIKDILLKD